MTRVILVKLLPYLGDQLLLLPSMLFKSRLTNRLIDRLVLPLLVLVTVFTGDRVWWSLTSLMGDGAICV